MEFDVQFAAGEDGTAFNKDTKAQFSAAPGDLNLTFVKRDCGI